MIKEQKAQLLLPLAKAIVQGVNTAVDVTEDGKIKFVEWWQVIKVIGVIFEAAQDTKDVEFSKVTDFELGEISEYLFDLIEDKAEFEVIDLYDALVGARSFAAIAQRRIKK